MLLSEFLHSRGIRAFAGLPITQTRILRQYLLDRVPGAQTAVFCAIPYYVEGEDGNIAMFARPRDYHAFAAALDADVRAWAEARGVTAAAFADHSPFDEVGGAAAAGLGVIGDNGLLITEAHSSFIVLAELVTSLTPDDLAAEGVPLGDGTIRLCGHCGACRRACPGHCIGIGRDTCVSAVSQKKTALTPAEEDMIRESPLVWGCDTCQNVCPYTARAREAGTLATTIPYFLTDRIPTLTAAAVDAMPDEAYSARPFGWRPKHVMRRNISLKEKEDTRPS